MAVADPITEIQSGKSGEVLLPPGETHVHGEVQVTRPLRIAGAGAGRTVLVFHIGARQCAFRILSSNVVLEDVEIRVDMRDQPGPHDGEYGTAVTIGRYLYGEKDQIREIQNVTVRRVAIRRVAGSWPANSIFGGGAVSKVLLEHITIEGGLLGVGFHWGAAGKDVGKITGKTYHPHGLVLRDVEVVDSVEGFWFSSCYDVDVQGVVVRRCSFVFRLLPGDNGARFADAAEKPKISSNIAIRNVYAYDVISTLFAVRITGWGRSEIDKKESLVAYRDTSIENVIIHTTGVAAPRFGLIYLDRCAGIDISGVIVSREVDGAAFLLDQAREIRIRNADIVGSWLVRRSGGESCFLEGEELKAGATRFSDEW
jgi:hypothetical protein